MVAVKIFDKHCDTDYDTLKLVREIILIKKLNDIQTALGLDEKSSFVPKLYDIITPKQINQVDQFCIVMENIGTDLNRLLKHQIAFSQYHLLKVIYQTLCAMAFLHEANVMHRDIKSSNFLLSQDCTIKICDFGLSRNLPMKFKDQKNLNTQVIRRVV